MTPDAAHIPRTAAAPAPAEPADEAQKRAIAHAVWTDLLWLMPQGRTVTVTVTRRQGRGRPRPGRSAVPPTSH